MLNFLKLKKHIFNNNYIVLLKLRKISNFKFLLIKKNFYINNIYINNIKCNFLKKIFNVEGSFNYLLVFNNIKTLNLLFHKYLLFKYFIIEKFFYLNKMVDLKILSKILGLNLHISPFISIILILKKIIINFINKICIYFLYNENRKNI